MSPNHQLSDRVYTRLKEDVLAGALGCSRLNLSSLEARYASSATPVREALLRLVGERLIDLLPQGGFGVHTLDGAELRELYELNQRLLGIALTWKAKEGTVRVKEPPSSSLSPPIDILFLSLAETVGNRTFTDLIHAINDRLHCTRLNEPVVLSNTDEEYRALRDALDTDRHVFAILMRAFHRRRIKNAAAATAPRLNQ